LQFIEQEENAYRIRLLGDFRGYKQGHALFSSFPDEVSWRRALLGGEELFRVRYVRLTTYFLAPHCIPDEMQVIVGFSPDFGQLNG
jgi:hypothetical protein